MGYIDKNKAITKEITVKLTEIGKKYLSERDSIKFKISKFNLGDSDINYNTTQTGLEITDFSGDDNCADSSKFDRIKHEIFQQGLSIPYELFNTNGIGRIDLNTTLLDSINLSFMTSFIEYFTRFKINSNETGETILLNLDNRNSLGQGVELKLFVLSDMRIKIEYNNMLFGSNVYQGEIIYNEPIKKNKYYNLTFNKSGIVDSSFNLFLNGIELTKNHTYILQNTVVVPPTKFGQLFSKGKVYGSRTFATNRPLNFYERKRGHNLSYTYYQNLFFDIQFTEGLGSRIHEFTTGINNEIIDMNWI